MKEFHVIYRLEGAQPIGVKIKEANHSYALKVVLDDLVDQGENVIAISVIPL